MGLADLEQVFVNSRRELREWFIAHADESPGIWLVTYKQRSGLANISYDEVVQEALCFGWIDSTVRRLDEQRGMQLLTPRKRGSTWSASNKQRVARLQEQGLIEAAGLAAIRRAKADGSWTVLDAVERLEVPADLAAALAGLPGAQQGYDAYPPSARKQALWWVVSAKRPATRANRIERIVEAAARGERGWPQ
ncbi:MAG: YdeI/OmpD-associated family protein [Actinobacteria bacterium]|nr:YdeI/OmpD-associated family protein [Actinomycetota bacterium]